MIQANIFSVISNDSDVTDIVASRIYPVRLPQSAALPAVVYRILTTDPLNSIDGDSGVDISSLEVVCWAEDYATAHTLAAAVRAALTAAAGLEIVTETQDDDEDLETRNYSVTTNYSVWSVVSAGGAAVPPVVKFEFEGDGVETSFTFPYIFTTGSLLVFKNGLLDNSYTELGDRTGISFPSPPAGGAYKDEFLAYFINDIDAALLDPITEFVSYEFEGDGIETSFTFPSVFRSGSLLVFKNGLLTKTYTELGDQTGISFAVPPEGGDYKDEFRAYYAKN